jgi:outer membrane protein TolC
MVALQARKQLEQLAEKNIQLTEQEVRVAVAKAYYNIMIAEKRKELLDQNIARIDQLHRETRVIYENGLAEKLDVDRISITLTNLKTEQTRVKQLVDLTYMALKFQMGMQLDQNIALEDTLTEAVIDKELLSHDLELERRKEYQLLELQKTLNSYDLKRYKLGGLPTLVLFGNYGYTLYNMDRLFNPQDKWQQSALIGTKLTVPLFDGMQRRNKMLQAKFTLQKSENDMENLKLALQLEKENARITLQSNISALENQRSNMKLAEEVFNVAKVKYKEGVGSNLEVMNAESALKEAQTNYFSALYDAITSRIDLQKALGEL